MSLNDTPRANRLHIGIFGKRNSGKSSLINAITGHNIALVSDYAGTTADPVYKTMEIHPIGPCVLIDTAGFDDVGDIGLLRVSKTREAAKKTDIALIVFGPDKDIDLEKQWIEEFKKNKTPVITVLNKSDILDDTLAAGRYIEEQTGLKPVVVSSLTGDGIKNIYNAIMRNLPEDYDLKTITGGVVNEGDTVLLVMPQDIQAPKGRLILPQVQTTRELLDRKCVVISVTLEKLDKALQIMKNPPDVIITDSQVFKKVYEKKPAKSRLTSFSVLYAGYKGDIDYFIQSASAIDKLNEDSKVLIAEACTHAPLAEDIGREKIPGMLRKKAGDGLQVDIVSGADFPEDLSRYDLIIHCGACMFNRKYVLSRVDKAVEQKVPMTNYGITIAYLSGILDKINF
ncbi:MAG: [FeFe] hydrogenase H-cluster maturation GTPase HydF [Clostridiales bacterium]|nr:[FeFe] hydrogenase H-cluster maturation GTPase HydF [Clostridiales bacterium]